jgi:hypothetical protein
LGRGRGREKEAPQPRSSLQGGLGRAEKERTISTTGFAMVLIDFALYGVF